MPEKLPSFEGISPKKEKKTREGIEGEKEEKPRRKQNAGKVIDRRSFLKGAGVTGLAVASGVAGKFVLDALKGEPAEEKKKLETVDIEVKKEEPAKELLPTEQQLRIERMDKEVVGDTLEEQLKNGGDIVLDRSTKKAIYEKWHKSYSPEEENYPGLKKALELMQPWIGEMRKVFREEDVPEKYVFLAIPESHFDVTAVSHKKAGGPFQFTKETAKNYDLAINDTFDARFDPVLSARACARHLKYSYEHFNKDRDLALADYNGNYTNKYAKFRTDKNERNYDDYLEFREGRLNEFLSRPFFEHKVEKDDGNLSRIAKKYGLSVDELKESNGFETDLIRVGQILKLPPVLSVKKVKLRDSLENLNYPEKFYAVLDVIKENNLFDENQISSMSFDLIKVPKRKTSKFPHKVRKGEGLFAIARAIRLKARKIDPHFSLSAILIQKKIQEQNDIKDPRKVRAGQSLKIELSVEGEMTLLQMAEKYSIPISELKKFNPAVINSVTELPQNAQVRLPRKKR